MPKKCIICGEDALYLVKGTNNSYCENCASECFNDLSFLQHVEETAMQLKSIIDNKKE
jgi:Na+-translocating ferredoxin:NAD+ oxidoreductase RNF subunit RnfB